MILVNYLASVALLCIGLYALLTRRNLIKIVMGLSLMEASTYLFMVSLAYRAGSTAPVLLSPPAGTDRQAAGARERGRPGAAELLPHRRRHRRRGHRRVPQRRGADRPALPHAGRRPGPGDARMTRRPRAPGSRLLPLPAAHARSCRGGGGAAAGPAAPAGCRSSSALVALGRLRRDPACWRLPASSAVAWSAPLPGARGPRCTADALGIAFAADPFGLLLRPDRGGHRRACCCCTRCRNSAAWGRANWAATPACSSWSSPR